MTFQTALQSGDYTKLRGTGYSADYLLKFCSNSIVFAARLNGAQFGDVAGFVYNNVTVGAYTDIVVGQVVLVGDTSDITKARFRGRVRKTPTSSAIWTNEAVVSFADQAYIWVINTYDAQYKLSRPDASGNELIDYDTAYEGMQPSITGLQTVYANYDPAGGNFRIAFSVSAFAKQSGNTISSYAWTFKSGTYTVISGSLASSAVTVDISPSEQWAKLVVTDSAGVTATRHILIQACDDSLNPPDTYIDPFSITGDLQRGWAMQVNAFAGVDSVLNNTVVVVFRANEVFNGTAGTISIANNIAFFGWAQRETDVAMSDREAGPIETVTFDFNGVSAALARLNSQLVPFYNSATPTAWGYIKNLTPWRGIAHYLDRYTTISTLCDLSIDDTSDLYLFPTLTTQGGTALAVIQGLAAMINSVIEFAPDGRMQMVKDATYQNSLERAADVVVGAFQTQDCLSLQRDQEVNKGYGLTDTDGAYYNTALGHAIGFTARAPGIARDEAQGADNLPNQLLAATSDDTAAIAELLQRVTNRFEFVNNNEYLEVEFPDGYNFLIPSRQQLYTFTISAITSSGVNRIIYDTSTSWLLESVTVARSDGGVTAVKARFHVLQRIGTGGINTTLIPPGDIPLEFPDPGLPSFPFQDPAVIVDDAGGTVPIATPPNPIVADNTGQTVIAVSATNAWLMRNFINLTTPPSVFVPPSDLGSFLPTQVLFDPLSPNDAVGAYILANDGTNSAVWYCPNVMVYPPVWTKGANVSGIFETMRATKSPGVIALIGAAASPYDWTLTFNFVTTEYNPPWSTSTANGNVPKGWVSGTGYQSGISGWIITIGGLSLTAPSSPCTISVIEMDAFTLYNDGVNGGGSVYCDVGAPNTISSTAHLVNDTGGTFTFSWTTPPDIWGAASHTVAIHANATSFDHNHPTNNNNTWISGIRISGMGSTPTY